MPDEDSQTVPDQPDPAHIESLQEERLRVAQVATREQYARQCLAVFAPEPGDGTLSYIEVLQRLQAVIAKELEEDNAHA